VIHGQGVPTPAVLEFPIGSDGKLNISASCSSGDNGRGPPPPPPVSGRDCVTHAADGDDTATAFSLHGVPLAWAEGQKQPVRMFGFSNMSHDSASVDPRAMMVMRQAVEAGAKK